MPINKIYKRDKTIKSFDKKKISQAIFKAAAEVGEHDMKIAKILANKVVDILEHHFPKIVPTVENVQDIIERVLIEDGHANITKAYILYRQKHKEIRENRKLGKIEHVPYKTVWQALVWNLDHKCETIEKLNKYVIDKNLLNLVRDTEKAYEEKLNMIVSKVEQRVKNIKLFIICGPSCSGKTTTTELLIKKLKRKGINFLKLNIDNYLYDTSDNIEDIYGDHDYEGPYALDIPLINQHFEDLFNGKTIEVPRYSFKTGTRVKQTDKLKRKNNEVVFIDSYLGAYPKLTQAVPMDQKYIIYLETFSQLRDKDGRFIRWTDIRMLRRMIRDVQFRACNPLETVGHWHYVRQGELKNIIPYIPQVNYIINTSLAYELPILKHHIFKEFPKIIKTYKNNSDRQDAYIRAKRVYNLLKKIKEWDDDSIVPKKSILREFIGFK